MGLEDLPGGILCVDLLDDALEEGVIERVFDRLRPSSPAVAGRRGRWRAFARSEGSEMPGRGRA